MSASQCVGCLPARIATATKPGLLESDARLIWWTPLGCATLAHLHRMAPRNPHCMAYPSPRCSSLALHLAAQPYTDIGHMARNRTPTRPASPKPKQTPDVPAPQGPMIETHGQSTSAKPSTGEPSSPTDAPISLPTLRKPCLRTHGLSVASASPSFQERPWRQVREDPHRLNHNASLWPEIPNCLA